ncbi:MAG: hypothetical protein ABIK52_00130 [Bacteroidota bacterium]
MVAGKVIVLFGANISIAQSEGITPPFSKLSVINDCGEMVGAGDGLTVNIAEFEYTTGGQLPDTTQRYVNPVRPVLTLVITR